MSKSYDAAPSHPRTLVIAAFAAIYIIWGSTYLGIRVAIETMPPFLMGGVRFLIAGAALYGWLRWRGVPTPSVNHLNNAIIIGALLFGIGNGGVNWAEQTVPSGLTALMISVTPLWFALMDWLRPGGTRPAGQTFLGILVGFGGMVWLIGPSASGASASIHLPGVAAVLFASIAWAAGSLYSRYTPKPESGLMGGALQMLAGGAILTVTGLILGEADRFSVHQVSARSMVAFVYLTFVGSLVGFTAYNWLLKASTPARVSTYAYVNPVIAMILGWAIAGEKLTLRMWAAAGVILIGVVIITSSASRR